MNANARMGSSPGVSSVSASDRPMPIVIPERPRIAGRGRRLAWTLALWAAAVVSGAAPQSGASSSGQVRISIPVSSVRLSADSKSPGLAVFEGGVASADPGIPALPRQTVRALLPPDAIAKSVKVTIEGLSSAVIAGAWDVEPAPPFAVSDGAGTPVWPAGRRIRDGRDLDVYASDAYVPDSFVGRVEAGHQRRYCVVEIEVCPYRYNPARKTVQELTGGTLVVSFARASGAASAPARRAPTRLQQAAARKLLSSVVNADEYAGAYAPAPNAMLDGAGTSGGGGTGYVIVTTAAIQTGSTNLAAFVVAKQALGYDVSVVTESTWGGGTGNTAAERIRTWLAANYETMSIDYVLLVGNPDPATGDVPMKTCYPQVSDPSYPDCPTDFYYAELTGDWDLDNDGRCGEYYGDYGPGGAERTCEVVVGRIPYYGVMTDLDAILAKLIAYGETSIEGAAWRKRVLLPMKPSDAYTPGYQLGEQIKDLVVAPKGGWTYSRVYESTYGLSPAPEVTPCSVASVGSAWRGVPAGATFWWTHGNSTVAASVMDLATVATLDNAHPAFTFQCSCDNAYPEVPNNLAYALLRNGVISAVAGTRVTWYAIGQTSFTNTASNGGMTYQYARRLISDEMFGGDALQDLRSDLAPNHEVWWMNYLSFNLYGCPAVGLFASFPDLTPPVVGAATAPAATNGYPIIVRYSGASDTGGSFLNAVELWYKKGSGGAWTDSGLRQTGASGIFSFLRMSGAETYYFVVVAVDGAGNRSAEPAGSGDCQTVYTGPVPTINVVLSANGGVLEAYTSQYNAACAAANLTDGRKGTDVGFWASTVNPGTQGFVYSFSDGSYAAVSNAVIYNYGQADLGRYSKAFSIWGSVDGTNYTQMTNGTLAASTSAQAITWRRTIVKRVKLLITSGYLTNYWDLGEFEVNGTLGGTPDTTPPVAGTASSPATTSGAPIVVTYAGALDTGGSGLTQVELWYKKGAAGTWRDSGLRQTGTSGSFSFTAITWRDTYYFALVAQDGADNRSPAASGSGACQTAYDGPVTPVNLLLPASGGVLAAYTSQYSAGCAAACLTDGAKGGASGFWVSTANPGMQGFVYAFSEGGYATVSNAVIYNYGQDSLGRYSRAFQIWSSTDGTNYTLLTNGTLSASTSAQAFSLRNTVSKSLKLVIASGYVSSYWALSEFEVYGVVGGTPDTTAPVAGAASAPAATNGVPIVVTYAGASDTGGSGLTRVELWYKKGAAGTWRDSGLRQTGGSGSFSFVGVNGNDTYYFDLVAQDGVDNRSSAVSGDGDCQTVYVGPVTPVNLLLPANGGVLAAYTSQYSAGCSAAFLTDGAKGGASGFWVSAANPGVQGFVYTFSDGSYATVSNAVLYNYGQDLLGRYSQAFQIWSSSDGTNYVPLTNGTLSASTSAQTFSLRNTVCKSLKLVITSGYVPAYWDLSEFEVYGTVGGTPDVTAPVAGTASAPATTSGVPIIVTYAGASDTGGSGLSQVELWYRKGAGGTWRDSGLRQTGAAGSFIFAGVNGNDSYYFDLVAQDGVNNRSAAASGDGDCQTVYAGPVSAVNLLLPANGGHLAAYTSQYSVGCAATNLADGAKGAASGFWVSAVNPGVQGFVYTFSDGGYATVSNAVIYNYGQDSLGRYSKTFQIWSSTDGTNYSLLTNGTLSAGTSAQAFSLRNTVSKGLKLVITSGYVSSYWSLSEFEVYGTLGGTPDVTAPVAGTAGSPAATNGTPIAVTYAGASDAGGSGLTQVELWYKKGAAGTWRDSGLRQTGASGSFSFATVNGSDTYYFDLVAQDGVGNRSAAAAGSGDCQTTYVGPVVAVNLLLPANGGVLAAYTSQYSAGCGAANLTDGTKVGSAGFWVSALNPGVQGFVYTFSDGGYATLSNAVIYNYGQDAMGRYSKAFQIWSSSDGTNYALLTNGTLSAGTSAQTFSLRNTVSKRVKLVIASGYVSDYWDLSEFEVNGTVGGTPDVTSPVAGTASSPASTNGIPIMVTYEGAFDAGGSGLSRVELWYRKGAGGTWRDSGLRQAGASGSFSFTAVNGNDTYYFDLVAQDGVANRSAEAGGGGDSQTAYVGPVAAVNLLLPANGGALAAYTSQYSAGCGAVNLTDGQKGVASGFWVSGVNPGAQGFVYTFSDGGYATVSNAVIYNYGQDAMGRYSRAFQIWNSTDGTNYALLTNGTLSAGTSAQTFSLRNTVSKRLKLVIASGYVADYWELSEFEVYGTVGGTPAAAEAPGGIAPGDDVSGDGLDSVGDGIPDAWRRLHFGGSGTSVDLASRSDADPDGDGMSNAAEYRAATDPTRRESRLEIIGVRCEGPGVWVTWIGGGDAWQYVDRATGIGVGRDPWATVFTNRPPTAITNVIRLSDPGDAKTPFFRIRAGR